MVILKMDVLSDSEAATKKEPITLDAKLLKNSDFYKQIQTLVKAAATSESKQGSNINKVMSDEDPQIWVNKYGRHTQKKTRRPTQRLIMSPHN